MSTQASKPQVKSELSSAEVSALTRALAQIEVRGRTADYDRACWARRVSELCGLFTRRVMVRQLGLNPSSAVSYVCKMEALQVISDREVWIAAGWSQVAKIARLDSASRAAVITRILEARGTKGVTSPARVSQIMAPFVPASAQEADESEQNGVARALEELKYLLDTYDLPGYKPPAEVTELLKHV